MAKRSITPFVEIIRAVGHFGESGSQRWDFL